MPAPSPASAPHSLGPSPNGDDHRPCRRGGVMTTSGPNHDGGGRSGPGPCPCRDGGVWKI
jgi:hypothetical protein